MRIGQDAADLIGPARELAEAAAAHLDARRTVADAAVIGSGLLTMPSATCPSCVNSARSNVTRTAPRPAPRGLLGASDCASSRTPSSPSYNRGWASSGKAGDQPGEVGTALLWRNLRAGGGEPACVAERKTIETRSVTAGHSCPRSTRELQPGQHDGDPGHGPHRPSLVIELFPPPDRRTTAPRHAGRRAN